MVHMIPNPLPTGNPDSAFPWPSAACWTAIVAVCTLRAWIGVGGCSAATHDLFCFLDGGWRVLQGQVPYRDFITDAGPFTHLVTALGLRLAHGQAVGLGYGQALLGIVIGAWCWAVTAGRLRPFPRAAYCVSVVLLAVAPVILGDRPDMTAPSEFYNRNGSALVALIMVEAVCRRERESNASQFLGGLSSGCGVALALFVKVTYCAGGGFLILALIPCIPQTRRRWAGLAAGAAAVILPFWLYLGGSFLPMIHVLAQFGAAKRILIDHLTFETALMYLLPMAVFVLWVAWRGNGDRANARRMIVAFLAVSAAGMLFQVTNDPRVALPLNPLLAILLVQLLGPLPRVTAGSRPSTERLLLACFSALLILPPVVWDTESLFYALRAEHEMAKAAGTSFDAPPLRGVESNQWWYVGKINDGFALLKSHLRPGDAVCALDFSNPFSFAFGLRSPNGGTTAGLRYGYNFTYQSHPAPEFLMRDASIVMVPELFTDGTLTDTLPRIYGPYLNAHFHLETQSRQWRMYRRNE
jgi:hypothetical protein